VSNADSASYTRQTPVLSPYVGVPLPEGFMPGGGVTLSALQRNVDDSLEDRLRVATGDRAAARQRLGLAPDALALLLDRKSVV
jgi:flagellar hook-associated protein FlgK